MRILTSSRVALPLLTLIIGGCGGGSSAGNSAPVIADQSFTITEDSGPLEISLGATDKNGDSLTYSTATPATNGATFWLDKINGIVEYYPAANFSGADAFSVTVSDGELSATAQISITITAVNDAPRLKTSSVSVRETQAVSGQLEGSDAEGDSISFSLISAVPENATLTISSDGMYSYQHSTLPDTPVVVTVGLSDGSNSTTASLSFIHQSDPLAYQQWHLDNTGQDAYSSSGGTSGKDINIGSLHMQDQTGSGVKVAVIDSGLEIGHEDLKANVLAGRSYDFINSDNDPTSSSLDGDHGTSVAGLIAATGFNDLGGRGVAPDAALMGLNWLQSQSFLHWQQSLGGTRTDDARVINLSYGLDVSGPLTFFDSWNNAAESHLSQVQTSNNAGKGVVFIKSAGNSFDEVGTSMTINGRTIYGIGNYYDVYRWSGHISGTEPESSSIYYTVVSALNADGTLASYSSTGASVWVSAPGGEYGTSSPAMITTDQSGCVRGYATAFESGFDGGSEENSNCNYTSSFNGTSSAAPVASGVAALIIAANPDLHWRDIRHILASTAVKVDSSFMPVSVTDNAVSFSVEPGWITNSAGYHFHNWYGFGMVDATAAVTMATDTGYESLGPLQNTGFVAATETSSVTIPEGADGVSRTVAITDNYTVEGVQVRFSATHPRDADISVEVTSPAGTRSLILPPRSLLVLDQDDSQDADFDDTVLLSNAFYGESSQGSWTITVRDTNSGDFKFYAYDANTYQTVLVTSNNPASGTLDSVSLRIYGH